MKVTNGDISVSSEIGKLIKVLIHSPGGEMNNILPVLREEWLFDDIVFTENMQKEYKHYLGLLLLFMETENIDKLFFRDQEFDLENLIDNPNDDEFWASKLNFDDLKVLPSQYILSKLFESDKVKTDELLIAVSAFHKLHINIKRDLLEMNNIAHNKEHFFWTIPENSGINLFNDLIKTLITGKLEWEYYYDKEKSIKYIGDKPLYIFEPIPNYIFTRDIGVTVNDFILITKPRYEVRYRETLLLKFIIENYNGINIDDENIIEISEDNNFFQKVQAEKKEFKVNFEGGDVMMISPEHLLIGNSQRTSNYSIQKLVHRIFKEDTKIKLISVIKIAEKRDQMHIDTVFTQVAKNVWMLHYLLYEDLELEDEDLAYSHQDIIAQKTKDDIRREKTVSVLQFYKNNYKFNKASRHETDFYIYSSDELEAIDVKDRKGKMSYSDKSSLVEKYRGKTFPYEKPKGISDFLTQVSMYDFDQKLVKFIWSGNRKFPYSQREQWTDACNLLCLGNGNVIGYDRNVQTAIAFENVMREINSISKKEIVNNKTKRKDYSYVVWTVDLFENILKGKSKSVVEEYFKTIKNTLFLLPSGELSRARGGSHCMSMPIYRENIFDNENS